MSNESLGRQLLGIARNAIAGALSAPCTPLAPEEASDTLELDRPAASFVTLNLEDALRGCIGSLEAWRPLRLDVAGNACSAAFRDPRFPPLSREEFDHILIDVSLLTPPERMAFEDEADALAQLRPGIDGLIFSCGGRRSTFLPQVWESLPAPRRFLARLKQKAGFSADFWSPAVELARYRARKWQEGQP